jgi:metal-sulfur cluster biosynthetic enzyme
VNVDQTLSREALMAQIALVKDPELQMSIVDLGMVYDARADDEGNAHVLMTLTSPACPVGPILISTVEDMVRQLPGIQAVEVEVTFTPPWDPRTMASEELQMQLGIW